MLDDKSLTVFAYLKNHFATSDKIVERVDILSTGLSIEDISQSIKILENNGYINVNHDYVSEPIESINN